MENICGTVGIQLVSRARVKCRIFRQRLIVNGVKVKIYHSAVLNFRKNCRRRSIWIVTFRRCLSVRKSSSSQCRRHCRVHYAGSLRNLEPAPISFTLPDQGNSKDLHTFRQDHYFLAVLIPARSMHPVSQRLRRQRQTKKKKERERRTGKKCT